MGHLIVSNVNEGNPKYRLGYVYFNQNPLLQTD